MTRYYKDPFKVMPMARDYKVKFLNCQFDPLTSSLRSLSKGLIKGMHIDDPYYKYIIHPDSYHIFDEPQVGDLGVLFHKDKAIDYPVYNGKLWATNLGAAVILLEDIPIQIIQRNNEAFHWYEEE